MFEKNTESEFSEFEFSKILLRFGNHKMVSNTDHRYVRKYISTNVARQSNIIKKFFQNTLIHIMLIEQIIICINLVSLSKILTEVF